MENSSEDRLRLLVVDDTEDNRELFGELFSSRGYDVATAGSVQEARHVISTSKQHFDLILSDISMPVETGFDLLAWRNAQGERLSDVPVLLITAAMPDDEFRVRGLAMGAVDYVIRPICNDELLIRVHKAIDNSRTFNAMRTALNDSQNLANVGRILAAANHEIRNLSTLVLITAEQVAQAFTAPSSMNASPEQQALSALTKSAQLLAKISHTLNASIGQNTLKVSILPVNLVKAVNDIQCLMRIKADSTQIKNMIEPTAIAWALADETRLKQILINFILNALDAIADGPSPTEGRIELRITELNESQWQIRVTDNGSGLATPGCKSDFQPFATTKSLRGGKGLGLWWCAQLASSMRGAIEIRSEGYGLGTTAILTLEKTAPYNDATLDINKYLI